MAPFNLSDLAVKEAKIHSAHLSPAKSKNFVVRLLAAHFLDFWAIFWATTIATSMFKLSFQVHLTTRGLHKAWDLVSFSSFTVFAWTAIAMTYFFVSYFMNHGQTAGMKIMKCRVKMKHHDAKESLHWAVRSIGLYMSVGLTSKSFKPNLGAHDYLWHELVAQKEIAAPDIRTLVTEEVKEEFAEAA